MLPKSYYWLLVLLLLPTVSAVTLDSGTVLNTTSSNSSMTFVTCQMNVTQVDVFDNAILLTDPQFNTGSNTNFDLPSTINYTDENDNIDCGEIGEAFGTEFNLAARNACTQMVVEFGGFPVLVGLVGTIVFLGAVIFLLAFGFVSIKFPGFEKAKLFSGVLTVVVIGVLVIVGLVMIVALCANL